MWGPVNGKGGKAAAGWTRSHLKRTEGGGGEGSCGHKDKPRQALLRPSHPASVDFFPVLILHPFTFTLHFSPQRLQPLARFIVQLPHLRCSNTSCDLPRKFASVGVEQEEEKIIVGCLTQRAAAGSTLTAAQQVWLT